jgi:hypothetical protein
MTKNGKSRPDFGFQFDHLFLSKAIWPFTMVITTLTFSSLSSGTEKRS